MLVPSLGLAKVKVSVLERTVQFCAVFAVSIIACLVHAGWIEMFLVLLCWGWFHGKWLTGPHFLNP